MDKYFVIDLLSRHCRVEYYPSQSPDLCWEAVRTCPDAANSELKMLCERGPSNYINITMSKAAYRNQFCAMCHGENLSYAAQPNDLQQNSDSKSLSWRGDRLMKIKQDHDDEDLLLLAVMQPKLQTTDNNRLDDERKDFTSFESYFRVITCSFFMDTSQNFCDEELNSLGITSNETGKPIWDLGSLACFSQYHKVCDLFVVSDSSKAPECTDPGCGANMVLDPSSLECQQVSGYFKNNEVIRQLDQRWHSDIICSYQSQCRAAELGFLKVDELNCYCDQSCRYYNDCCEDSPHQATDETRLEDDTFNCYRDNSDLRASASEDLYFWGIMQVDRCPTQFNDSMIKSQCESGPDINRYSGNNFGIISTPVTHTHTGLRYVTILRCFLHALVVHVQVIYVNSHNE